MRDARRSDARRARAPTNSLNLNRNDIASFVAPANVAKKLKRLSLERNGLVNASFRNMAHLDALSLANNELESVPCFDGCKKLAELSLAKNRIASCVALFFC